MRVAVERLERRTLLSGNLAFQGTPQGVPGTIEAEKYDVGGEGVSYHDTDPQNHGGQFRRDGVDLNASADAGGKYLVGWTAPGEWLNYTVNVAATTTYTLDARVAAGGAGGTFHLSVDGKPVTGPTRVGYTGGWQAWKTISVPNVPIPAGQHVIRLTIDSQANRDQGCINFNWLRLRDDPTTSPRLAWWRDARFGMFIHWGLYSQLAGHWNGQTTPGLGEWIMNDLHIPASQYAQVAKQFNPTQFNAAQWVQIAKNAGMKYIVITSKHHDGLSMFKTSANAYNIVDATPFHRDPLAELSSAAHAAGLHFGTYYSILNWTDPTASAAGIDQYMQTMETQLRELVTKYNTDVLWFDGEWPTWWTDERGRELEEFLHNLKPGIIINNRVGKRLSTDGDYNTPEQAIPASASAGRLWETAMTLNDTWGYKDTDTHWKSPYTVIRNLADIAGKGGNFLLNVGPTGQGIIPTASVQILQQVGNWLNVNGEAVYGTTLAPMNPPSWGSVTRKGNSLYAIVFNWPTNGVLHLPVVGSLKRATVLGTGATLGFTSDASGANIFVPRAAPNAIATVIRLDFGAAPRGV